MLFEKHVHLQNEVGAVCLLVGLIVSNPVTDSLAALTSATRPMNNKRTLNSLRMAVSDPSAILCTERWSAARVVGLAALSTERYKVPVQQSCGLCVSNFLYHM